MSLGENIGMPKIVIFICRVPCILGRIRQLLAERSPERSSTIGRYKPGNGHVVQFNIQDPCDRWYEKGENLTDVGGYVVQMDKMEIAKSHVVLVNATDPGWGTSDGTVHRFHYRQDGHYF